ncbi:hypothetical protein F7725_010472 [Dissostichus mawsoni]|uniref:Ig-like domain-containing protein n=1 Tax=Dissostichus mawsoni TaxID=36200 RepID=A0A7J5XNQ5_DISMA|nr:hypothetical protein F7725_010472 [Dissostichus mawsoni]
MTFLNGTFLRVKGPEPDITAIIQGHQSDPVLPGDSVTLQCAVLSESQSKTCPGETRVYWFRAGSDESHPVSFTPLKTEEMIVRIVLRLALHGNVSTTFLKTSAPLMLGLITVLWPHVGRYYLDMEQNWTLKLWDQQKAIVVLLLLAAPFAISPIDRLPDS